MPSNNFRDVEASDYFDEIRKAQAENLAGNTSQGGYTPHSLLLQSDEMTISDAVTINGGSTFEFDNTMTLSDAFTNTEYTAGLFQITDDAGAGTGVTQPCKIDFGDLG